MSAKGNLCLQVLGYFFCGQPLRTSKQRRGGTFARDASITTMGNFTMFDWRQKCLTSLSQAGRQGGRCGCPWHRWPSPMVGRLKRTPWRHALSQASSSPTSRYSRYSLTKWEKNLRLKMHKTVMKTFKLKKYCTFWLFLKCIKLEFRKKYWINIQKQYPTRIWPHYLDSRIFLNK